MKTIGRCRYPWRGDWIGFCLFVNTNFYVKASFVEVEGGPGTLPSCDIVYQDLGWRTELEISCILYVICQRQVRHRTLKMWTPYPWIRFGRYWLAQKHVQAYLDLDSARSIIKRALGSRSRSVNQDNGSADLDPKEIFMDPQHRSRIRSWKKHSGSGFGPDSNMIEKGGGVQQKCWQQNKAM